MNDVFLDDTFNPKFVHFSNVRESELDPFRRLPKAALISHIDEAVEAWEHACGAATTAGAISIEYLEPVIGAQTLRIDIWVQSLLERAVDLASLEGLEGLTIGHLAEDLGMSKSGLFAHFGSKEELQLATISAAGQRFIDEVFRPALKADRGY